MVGNVADLQESLEELDQIGVAQSRQNELVYDWVEDPNSKINDVEAFINICMRILENQNKVIPVAKFESILLKLGKESSIKLLLAWVNRADYPGNIAALNVAIEFSNSASSFSKNLIPDWITRSKAILGTQEIIKCVAAANIPEKTKKDIYKSLITEVGEENSIDCMIDILNNIEDKSESCQFDYIETWLIVGNRTSFKTDAFLKVMAFAGSESLLDNVISSWAANAMRSHNEISGSFDSLMKIFDKIKNINSKSAIALKWISNTSNTPTTENIVFLIKLINNDIQKKNAITKWLERESDQVIRYKKFLDLIDAGVIGNPYSEAGINDIRVMFNKCFDIDFAFDKIINLCKYLYPESEAMQATFFEEVIVESMIYSALNASTLDADGSEKKVRELIMQFASSLQKKDTCISILDLGKLYSITPEDLLIVANNRLALRYVSLAEALNQPLSSALTVDGCVKIEEFFGRLRPDTKLSALWAYADMHDVIPELFHSNVDPLVFEQIKKNYQPPASSPCILADEHSTLIQTFHVEPLPQLALLCDYLKSNVAVIPPMAQNIFHLKYAVMVKGSNSDDEIKYKKKFLALLDMMDEEMSLDDRTHKVGEFFNFITETNQGISQQDKLYELLNALRPELVWLFSEKNGITEYLDLLTTLDDGCVANIAMKTKMYIYGKLIDPKGQNKHNVILYLYLCDHIALPFFKTGDMLGGAAAGDSADVFKNLDLRTLHISMPGLLAGIAAMFYNLTEAPTTLNQAKPTINPYSYICGLATEDECFALYEHLSRAFPKYAESIEDTHGFYQQSAHMASYLIIRQSMPELLNSPYLDAFKKDCEKWLSPEVNPEPSAESPRTRLKI